MKNVVAFVVALLAVAAGAAFLVNTTRARAEDAEVAAALAEARTETLRQVVALAPGADDKVAYDKQQAVRKQTEAVADIRKKYPTYLKEDSFIADMEMEAKAGKKDKAKTAEYRIRYDYAKSMFDSYLKGTAKPILTGYSNGLRFDLMAAKKTVEAGQDGLRFDVLIWGAPPRDQLALQNIEFQNVVYFKDMESGGKRRGQPKRTVVTVNITPAMPYVLLDKPWEWIPEWPMGVMAGYYIGIPAFDSRTDHANISLKGTMRAVGGTQIPIDITWRNVKIPGEWKGDAGGKWDDANLQPLNDDDLKEQGVDVTALDAPAAPAP